MKILLFDKIASGEDLCFDRLAQYGEVIDLGVCAREDRMLSIARDPRYEDAEALLVNKAPVTAAVLDAFKNLRYVGVFATGYNNVDIPRATERGVTVCNVPGYSTEAVAQLVFALILQIASATNLYTDETARGKWIDYPVFSMCTHRTEELFGKTLGVFGYGAIGRRVAKIGAAFGMRVIVCSRSFKPDCPYKQVSRDELLAESDYLSLNAPLNDETALVICRDSIGKMKDGAVLINTARGGLVDEQALAQALKSGKLRAAGLDVLQKEPMSPDCPLFGLPNCHITPHVAWTPKETRERLLDTVCLNLRRFLEGRPIHKVN